MSVIDDNTTRLLEKMYLFLENAEWQDADIYCDKVLDIDSKNSEAYLGKLMAELQVKKREELAYYKEPFDDKDNYRNAIRFGDETLENELRGYIAHIKERNEYARKNRIYENAVSAMNTASTEDKYKSASQIFQATPGFKDADDLAKECLGRAEQLKKDRLEKAETERLMSERKAEEEYTSIMKKSKRRKIIIFIFVFISCVCTAITILLNTVIIPNKNYNYAIKCTTEGKIIEAYEKYVALNGYKDSNERASEIFEQYKVEKIKTANVGDRIIWGAYEQDNNTENGKENIEWIVLAKDDNKILVISDKVLDCQQYNTSPTDVTWETCSLREWMNSTFINEAFSGNEQARIIEATVSADENTKYNSENPRYSTDPGNETIDKVFLLSMLEVSKYFSSDEAKKCVPTDYAVACGAFKSKSYTTCYWWLRTPGLSQDTAVDVMCVGTVNDMGYGVSAADAGVRPAMWIDLES